MTIEAKPRPAPMLGTERPAKRPGTKAARRRGLRWELVRLSQSSGVYVTLQAVLTQAQYGSLVRLSEPPLPAMQALVAEIEAAMRRLQRQIVDVEKELEALSR